MATTKQRSTAGKSVAIFFIVFMVLEALIIFGVASVFKNKDVTPSIAGYSMYIMDTDAMGDAIPKGSLVIASNGSPSPEGIKKAVLAEEVPGVGTSVFWLADVSTSADLSGVVYTVFQEKDPNTLYRLKTSNIVGTASTYYETAGKIITFMTSKFGMIVLIAAPLCLLVLLELIIMVVNRARFSEYDYDDEDEEDEEKEQPVQLDDFLFGGKKDKELINNSIHQNEQPDDIDFGESVPVRNVSKQAQIDDEPEPAKPAEKEIIFDELPVRPASKKSVEVEPEEKEPENKPDIDPSYYEKASRVIDHNEPIETVKPAEVAPAAEEKPAPDMKSVTAGFEDLMKLMEQESSKLKSQLDEK